MYYGQLLSELYVLSQHRYALGLFMMGPFTLSCGYTMTHGTLPTDAELFDKKNRFRG